MSCADNAYRILRDADGPLHYLDIAKRIEARAATVENEITQEIRDKGNDSRFCRVGIGVYAIASPETLLLCELVSSNVGISCGLSLEGGYVEWQKSGLRSSRRIVVRSDLACVIAAWDRLDRAEREAILDLCKNAVGRTNPPTR